jgi:hypothetical protein
MIVHVFVGWSESDWDEPARNAAAAEAVIAKRFYMNQPKPSATNLSFDHMEGNGYYYCRSILPFQARYFVDGDQGGPRAALQNLGFNGFDDFALTIQTSNGGWDNVIVVFHAATPPSPNDEPEWTKSYAIGSYWDAVVVRRNSGQMAHEWGHSFGACDEYATHCARRECECETPFLSESHPNCGCWRPPSEQNPERCPGCAPGVAGCIMDAVSSTELCGPTREYFAWGETATGIVPVLGALWPNPLTPVTITGLSHDQTVLSTDVANAWAYPQSTRGWAVVGLRSPADADHNLRLFADNNHRIPYATSSMPGQKVDFVVGDYGRNNLGNEHLLVERASGAAGSTYALNWNHGGEAIAAGAPQVSIAWPAGLVVRAWDLPLLAGQSVEVSLQVVSGALSTGAAVFRGTGTRYFAGRDAAIGSVDDAVPGAGKSFRVDATETGTYGLVVWSNHAGAGQLSLQVTPLPPGPITDLGVDSEDCWSASVVLGWTATGDVGSTGTATAYDLRMSTSPITPANFMSAVRLSTGAPRPAGSHESLEVGLGHGARRYFAIRAVDDAGQYSPFAPGPYVVTAPSPDNCLEFAPRVVPSRTELYAPEPNPTSGSVVVRYAVASSEAGQPLELGVFDVAGRRVVRLRGATEAGSHRIEWNLLGNDGGRVAAGTYYLRLRIGDRDFTRRLVVMP